MSDTVIRVENLGKRYLLKHQQQGRSRYIALRDVIADGVKAIGQRILHPNQHRPSQTREEFWALKDVSFEVKRGDRIGIIGHNGAGKSTLLKLLSRITEPSTGIIKVKGRVASLLEVGTGFHPELTGRENIFLNGSILGMTKSEILRNFDDIVAFSEVERFLDTPVKYYSSGMYVRLAFAVASHLNPEILVVDEVLAVGDVSFQKKSLAKMRDVSAKGQTVLFVSHDMKIISNLSEKAILLNQGKINVIGDTKTVIESYYKLSNSANANSSVNLSLKRRSGGDQKIEFTQLELKNSKDEITNLFSVGEQISIYLKFKSYLSSQEFEIGYSIKALDGTILFTSSTSDSGELLEIFEGEFLVKNILNPNYLKPGTYCIQVGITCGYLRDLISEATWFQIMPLNTREGITLALPGYFCFPYQWTKPKLLL